MLYFSSGRKGNSFRLPVGQGCQVEVRRVSPNRDYVVLMSWRIPMSEAVGPIYAAGFQNITKSGYSILYLPDLHNDELQREGKAPVYWWLPNGVRLAQKDSGDF